MSLTVAPNKLEVSVLLHNIRSVHNVGSIFRTSDALGITRIYMTGHTPTPLDRFGAIRNDVAKVALGAERSIPWEYHTEPLALIASLKHQGVRIVSIEQDARAVDYKNVTVDQPTLFVFGNEVDGVEQAILDQSDIIAEIPMRGSKESLNVSVSFGIALYRMLGL